MRLNRYVASIPHKYAIKFVYFHKNIKIIFVLSFPDYLKYKITNNIMLGATLRTQPIHQNAYSKVVPLDGHLHCWSPLHSATHVRNKTITEVSLASKVLQPLCWVRGLLVPLLSTPTGPTACCYYVNVTFA